MAETTPPKKSTKEVKNLQSLIGEKTFFFPKSKANECDPVDGKPSIYVQIGAKRVFIHCEEQVHVERDVFSILRDCGIVSSDETYEVGGPFDPIRNYDQR